LSITEGEVSVNYQPLAQVRKTLRVKWHRSPIEFAKLRELSKRSDAQGWFQAGGHLVLWLFTGTLVYLFWSQQIWLAFALALFAHGTVASFFVGIAPHELGHGTVFQTKRLNTFFLYVYSLLGWWDPFDYASSHTYHHRYTLHPEGDRENLLPLDPSLRWPLLLQLFTVNLFTKPGRTFGKGGLVSAVLATIRGAFGRVGSTDIPINEWLQALHADQPEDHRKSIRWSRILLLFHGSVLVVSIATGLWVLPLIISFSSFIGNWGNYFLGLTQHCGLRTSVPDFRKSTRSIRINPVAEFLYWRMNWHIEHHMYAGVPCYNLKKLSREIAGDMPEPRTVQQAWREMGETWRRQQADPTYEFDTPLPATAKGHLSHEPGDLESSLGELAPKGLE
jgi:fatty acid desaturase